MPGMEVDIMKVCPSCGEALVTLAIVDLENDGGIEVACARCFVQAVLRRSTQLFSADDIIEGEVISASSTLLVDAG